MSKKKETKVMCPECGTEFRIPDKEFTAMATVVGKNSGLGNVYPKVAGQETPQTRLPRTAKERIEALQAAGVDVSNMFAVQGAMGGDFIASNKGGRLVVLAEDDPIFDYITKQGTVPNPRLFRRWVMSKMFYMLSYTPYRSKEPTGVTQMIHQLGYEYQWKMLMDELRAQMKMEGKDIENFTDRNRWFNAGIVTEMAEDYIEKLKKRVDALTEKKCKGIPYKRVCGRNIFTSDLQAKLYSPFRRAVLPIKRANNAAQLYNAAKKFNEMRIRLVGNTPQSSAWLDAYKGSGAYFTMQNMIRFHGCVAIDDEGKRLNKYQSLAFLTAKAEMYKNGEGWRLLAVLKKMLKDNNINIRKKMEAWRKQ